ncbi:MAG: hypothetical protein K2P93_07135 [Alphaproteobacteria bacterium]|nr:hypothetical protein [Alphaproteobacteria bacterium]
MRKLILILISCVFASFSQAGVEDFYDLSLDRAGGVSTPSNKIQWSEEDYWEFNLSNSPHIRKFFTHVEENSDEVAEYIKEKRSVFDRTYALEDSRRALEALESFLNSLPSSFSYFSKEHIELIQETNEDQIREKKNCIKHLEEEIQERGEYNINAFHWLMYSLLGTHQKNAINAWRDESSRSEYCFFSDPGTANVRNKYVNLLKECEVLKASFLDVRQASYTPAESMKWYLKTHPNFESIILMTGRDSHPYKAGILTVDLNPLRNPDLVADIYDLSWWRQLPRQVYEKIKVYAFPCGDVLEVEMPLYENLETETLRDSLRKIQTLDSVDQTS